MAQAELALAPQNLPADLSVTSGKVRFTFYHVSFAVPWMDEPTILASKNGDATQLKFPGGQFLTVLAQSPYAAIANTVRADGEANGSTDALSSMFGEGGPSDDFDWMKTILSATPGGSPADGTANSPQATLLAIKTVVLASLVGEPTTIYTFTLPYEGFDVVGSIQDGSETVPESHVVIYDSTNVPHDLIIGSANQSEVDYIISSVRIDGA